MMARDRDNLQRLIHEHGFSELEDYLMQHARPSIRVETQRVNDESQIPVGMSKIGGRPDLPAGINWPVNDHTGQSLAFIAQFELQDVKPFDEENFLPSSGMLYFFGCYNNNFGGKVLYTNAAKADLKRIEFPEDIPPKLPYEWGERYDPCSVTFIPEVNLTFQDATWVVSDYPAGKTWQDFYDLIYAASYTRPPHSRDVNRLLGYNYDVPEDMQLDCQIWDAAGRPEYMLIGTAQQRAAAETRKGEWQLLFQMSSDDNAGMMWSDAGMLCYYMRRDDLKAKHFDKACFTGFNA